MGTFLYILATVAAILVVMAFVEITDYFDD